MSEQEERPLETGGMVYAPVGIGGWLILPIIHLVSNAGVIAYYATLGFMRGAGAGAAVTAGSTQIGMRQSEKMLMGIGFFEIFFFIYALHCLQRFFRKKADVPLLMILFYTMLVAKTSAYVYLLYLFPDARSTAHSLSDAEFTLFKIVIFAAIWIPYFRVSVRVKNTFVR
jgi:hypothetical protein